MRPVIQVNSLKYIRNGGKQKCYCYCGCCSNNNNNWYNDGGRTSAVWSADMYVLLCLAMATWDVSRNGTAMGWHGAHNRCIHDTTSTTIQIIITGSRYAPRVALSSWQNASPTRPSSCEFPVPLVHRSRPLSTMNKLKLNWTMDVISFYLMAIW